MSGAVANNALVQANNTYNFQGCRYCFISGVCAQKRRNGCTRKSYLEFATVKLQQPPVREEQLTADNCCPEAARALKPLLLHQLRLPGSFQHHRLVRVRAPCTRRRCPCLWNDKHEMLQNVLHIGCTLSCCLDCRGDAAAEVQVAVGLCCNEVHMRHWVLKSNSLKHLFLLHLFDDACY